MAAKTKGIKVVERTTSHSITKSVDTSPVMTVTHTTEQTVVVTTERIS